jgi:chromosomal replication initiation ATPase DnaA
MELKTPNQMKTEIFNEYTEKLLNVFDITRDEMFSKSKRRDLVDARQTLYYACSKRPMRVVYIQKYMKESGYDVGHTTILHGIKEIEKRVKSDKDYADLLKQLKS